MSAGLRRTPGRLVGRLIFLAALAAVVAATVAPNASARGVTYRGHLIFGTPGEVTLRLQVPSHGRPHGKLTLRKLPLGCEDGSLQLISPPALRLTFTDRRQFQADRYAPLAPGATESYVGIHGSIAADGEHAFGNVFAYRNPYGGAPTGASDCSTQIDSPWRARRR